MMHETVFQEAPDRYLFLTFSEFTNSEKGASYRRRNRQKFVVSRDIPLSCGGYLGELSWDGGQGAFGIDSLTKDNLPNLTDKIFREAAEKVDNKITVNKRIYGGAPCVAHTRVPVYAILEMIEAGYSHKRILKAFPTINKEGLEAALRFAVLVMER